MDKSVDGAKQASATVAVIFYRRIRHPAYPGRISAPT
jgi:hypothetical protein